MPELIQPVARVHLSFLAAVQEFLAEGRGQASDRTMLGRETQKYGGTWSTPAGFAAYVEAIKADALPETPRAEGIVPATTLWYVDGDEYLGRLSIRHQLTEFLLEQGGHIGYDVRPSARRRGHATAMLKSALPITHALGIDPVLVTCDNDNVGSRKVIEASGGVLEDERVGKLRFWVPTG
ncbi:GNAT family N-acetyltransferase [Tenggerimyces flavus]|uniref:GNAT family N-acetyltransferase n=1 Tax=Tenggerimyces flavus TaxID=1708749 RepID=A0ABV7YI65_9ACTN|nr:GNAT family N-acetyltransferase [Tenggerimyces flavus]MBM7786016.1 putative acetyltransferase [Tenggerimyces flavus]